MIVADCFFSRVEPGMLIGQRAGDFN
jgi:hypothetical protein